MPNKLTAWLRQVESCVSVSLSVSLYVKGDAEAVKDGMVRCWEDYRERWGDRLRWFVEDDTGRFRTATHKVLDYPRRKLTSKRPSEVNVYWVSHGGEQEHHASPWMFDGTLRRDPQLGGLHAIRASRDTAADAEGMTEFVEMVGQWTQWLSVHHGYAGYSFNESADYGTAQHNRKHIVPASRRFLGIEIEKTSQTSRRVVDGIKSVNWLTLVSDELLAKVGGADELRDRFSDAIVLLSVRDGLMIQAGPKPELGDVNQQESLEHYREVMRVLRPLRVARHPSFGSVELGSFGPVETDEWMRRLDD